MSLLVRESKSAGGAPALNIAHWNGSTWSALGTGMVQILKLWNATPTFEKAAAPRTLTAGRPAVGVRKGLERAVHVGADHADELLAEQGAQRPGVLRLQVGSDALDPDGGAASVAAGPISPTACPR